MNNSIKDKKDTSNHDFPYDWMNGDDVMVPDETVYIGNSIGGNFISLSRQDIHTEGKVLPAFLMEVYAAITPPGGNYGEYRVGLLSFKGTALYVPPAELPPNVNKEPPEIKDFLVNNGMSYFNSGVLHVRLVPREQDPENKYIATIVPLEGY